MVRFFFIIVVFCAVLVTASCAGEPRPVRAQLDPTVPFFASVELRLADERLDGNAFAAVRFTVAGYPSSSVLKSACLKSLYTSGSLRRADEPVVCFVNRSDAEKGLWLCTWKNPGSLSDFELIESVSDACDGQIRPP